MRVYLDLDNTLLATRTFYNDYYKSILLASGNTEREIEASYRFFTNGTRREGELFSPKRQMEILGWRKILQEQALSHIENILREHRSFIFPDVVPALAELRKRDITLILLTFGHQEFQKQKIITSGIAHFFDEIIITPDSKEDILKEAMKEDERIMFVDDHEEYMKEFENSAVVQTFHMNRPEIGSTCSEDKCAAQYEIQSLKDILSFI